MTKEELQKEAYEWTEKNISVGISMYNPSIEMYCGKAYKDGAEPREKQIEIDAKHIRALQKHNGELIDKLKELEAQIEKMKCCANCKHQCSFLFQDEIDCAKNGFSKWEIKEK